MKRIHKASSDKLATMASRVLLDDNSSKRAKSLAGSVLAQHEPHEENKEKEKGH
ncbi:hypothetical protein [Sporocytophaga myxococcoides]|uniref:hypothetical protein n=1 Tax=Sporocytophaga myxococcoides TaxID=153721 RepID=UPI00138AF04E|nr:hypothetical protein [Sporocytophaga myxococcoides]